MNPENLVLVLRQLLQEGDLSQRQLAKNEDLSVGTVNRSLKYARDQGWLEEGEKGLKLTGGGLAFLENYRVENALILVSLPHPQGRPLVYGKPPGLLEVKGKPMVERQIDYLRDRGIDRIALVVGYRKEAFDYLIDKYQVQLIYNPDYADNNFFSNLYHASDFMDNTYILSGDCWLEDNVLWPYEPVSYISSVQSRGPARAWCLETTPAGWIKEIRLGDRDCQEVCGPLFFHRDILPRCKDLIQAYYKDPRESLYFWQVTLSGAFRKLAIKAKDQTGHVWKFRNLGELEAFDPHYWDATKARIVDLMPPSYQAKREDIHDLEPLKKGHCNLSYKFRLGQESFVFRQPGGWTRGLIDGRHEKESYETLAPLIVTDELVSLDEKTGIRITRYFEGARVADPFHDPDLRLAMEMIRRVHDRRIQVDYAFAMRARIDHWEQVLRTMGLLHFRDIDQQREKVDRLLEKMDQLAVEEVLCHGDYLYANLLFLKNGGLRLIDWEYSGMADPLMDVAMFGIFSYFDRDRLDLSLTYYLGRQAREEETYRLYLYAALAGYMWSMWGLLKQAHGFDLAEYPMKMYRYLKDYYRLLQERDPSLAD